MNSPQGWQEPGQRPEFDEVTLVLAGRLRVEHEGGVLEVCPGQALVTSKGEWIRYATPYPGGAEYVAICLPAFSPSTVPATPRGGRTGLRETKTGHLKRALPPQQRLPEESPRRPSLLEYLALGAIAVLLVILFGGELRVHHHFLDAA